VVRVLVGDAAPGLPDARRPGGRPGPGTQTWTDDATGAGSVVRVEGERFHLHPYPDRSITPAGMRKARARFEPWAAAYRSAGQARKGNRPEEVQRYIRLLIDEGERDRAAIMGALREAPWECSGGHWYKVIDKYLAAAGTTAETFT